MSASAGLPAAGATLPGQPVVPGIGRGRGAVRQRQPETSTPRLRRGRKVLRGAVSAAVVAAAFGFALPRFASYRSVWASLQSMTWPYAGKTIGIYRKDGAERGVPWIEQGYVRARALT